MIDKFNDWRGKDRRRHEVAYFVITHELSESTQGLIEQLIEAVKDGDMANPKLDAIIQMLQPLASVPADLALVKEELSLVHGLVADLMADPEKIKEFSERIRKQVEALKSAKPKSE